MSSNTIDLNAVLAPMNEAKSAVKEAEIALKAAQEKAAAEKTKVREKIIASLDGGATTGNPVKDEFIRHCDLDLNHMQRMVEFSNLLEQSKDKEMLLIFPWKMRTRFGGPSGGDEFMPTKGYILGQLSGERVSIKPPKSMLLFGVELPFVRYVRSGFERNNDRHGLTGHLVVDHTYGGEPDVISLVAHIFSEDLPDVPKCEVYLLDGPDTEPPKLFMLRGLRETLNMASPEEAAAAGGI